ncbi:hypothetical protein SELMODRAFT_428625 [Selaginella moellendorffii]|uniref:SEC7 domain-containing protein n=1 Tax=Selaginella moellendorffii TaxID=88036 RepID=D8T3G4_SELML|nr:hypothetical protein SELMODRAFT_428625 [Selaginella moellendorffii]
MHEFLLANMRNLRDNSMDCRNIKGDGRLDGEATWHLEPSILQQLRHGKRQTGTLQAYPQQELLLQKSAEPLETDQASTESAVTFEQRRVHKLELQGCMKDWAFNYKLFTLQEGIKLFNQKPARMSKAAFIKTNRGIEDGKDLPEEFMGGLYDRIVNKEIKMKADNVIPVAKPAGKDNNFLLGLTTS